MTWSPSSEQIWDELSRKPTKLGTLYAREFLPGPHGALVALDSVTGSRHLLLRCSDELVQEDGASRGVKLRMRELAGEAGGQFADFWCSDPQRHKLFGVMAEEVISRLMAGEGSGPVIALRVLRAWRALLSSERTELLSIVQQVGLLGELLVLEQLAGTMTDPLSAWKGPLGARHDFVHRNCSIEVKTTLRRDRITIHGLDQLASLQDMPLYLWVVCLSQGPNGSSLSQVVQRVRNLVADDERFFTALSSVGYQQQHDHSYTEQVFALDEERIMLVDNALSKITASTLVKHVNARAFASVNYELLLDTLDRSSLTEYGAEEFLASVRKAQ